MLKTNKILTAAVTAATLIGGIAAASDASAQGRYRGGRGYNNNGAAVAAGIAGLAVGAALASGNRGYYGGYGGGYYAPRAYGYGYGPGYYNRGYYAPPPRYYGGRGYYGGGYGRSCVYWDYDRWGRAYQVRGRC
jgi:hypothetical protein